MTHEFDSIIAIADELEISRQALNRKAKRLNIDLSKKSFTDKEWKLLALTKRKPKTSTSSNYVDTFTAQQIAEKDDLINYLKSQIKEKDKQIDHAQQLQLIAEQRLTETNKTLIEYQEKENQPKKGFWQRLFK
ncbi:MULTISPECIES: replication initiation protein [Leuconostoc]|uniref:replication initiation protein n=1 Tax=Leuconostoc TaxID=1243 RepID=UPI000A04CF52|nr:MULTISPECIES: replication initiation protein [Leuconostoc]MBU7451632.1 replication initiation protein [Leuconostoc citreum]MBZ5950629.1 replication initiation protein [Leuconostoc gasicomitatum]MCP9303053.1 replication initiation protein [Leuconostoc mesenteroides]MCP9327445.1 replication initiation protein [Leuconostoc mesenteroides]MCT3079593.1 replication initiation protein [Leuconostoc citreum]